jgi:hypothetical protein
MKTASTITLLSFLCLVQLFAACASNTAENANAGLPEQAVNQSSENSNKIGDTVESLKTIIPLPFEPEETVWREESVKVSNAENKPVPVNNKKLTAVLRFTAEDADKMASQAETHKPPTHAQIQTEDWFPAELIAQSELSGDETLKGMYYAANDFMQPPYTEGQIIRIENSNYFILELSAR